MSPSTSPLVSFIIPSYNHEGYIGECISSILNQDEIQDFEIVVVDDCSPDNSMAVLQSFNDPRLRVSQNAQNLGHVATLNKAITLARGKFIARQDSDNRYRPNFLHATLEVFKAHPQVALVYSDVAAMDSQDKVLAEPWDGVGARRLHKGNAFCGNELIPILTNNHVPVIASLARREIWAAAFPLPSWIPRLFIADDWYVLTRILAHHDSYYLPQVLVDYRLHPYNLHQRFDDGAQQEQAILRILDEIYANPERRAEKQRVRRHSYGIVNSMLATRYLVVNDFPAARRCYLRSFRYEPGRLLQAYQLRGLFHALIGTPRYQALKARLRGLSERMHDRSRSHKAHSEIV